MNILLRTRLVLFVLGIVVFFVGERYFGAESYHWAVSGTGLGLAVLAVLMAAGGMAGATKRAISAEAKSWVYIIAYQLLIIAGCVAYVAYSQLMGNAATPDSLSEQILLALWLLCVVIGIFAGIGAELSFAASGRGPHPEPKRVHRATLGWMMIGMLLAILVCFNFAVAKKDKAWDWSYLKATTPSDSTVAIVGSAKEPLDVAVFYARDNEVLPYVKEYFSFLDDKAETINVAYYDKDMHPTQAEEYKASRNGQVIFRLGERRERIDIGDDLTSARSMLKKLDEEVQKIALRLSQEKKRIYFTRGHGEMSWVGQDDPLRSIDLLEKVLRSQNYTLRLFGVAEGSATEVPDDAAAVIIAGPTQAFMQAEVDALEKYLDKGGKVFALLDVSVSLQDTSEITATADDPLRKFFAGMGIKFVKKTLGNEKNYISATRSDSDSWFIFSNTFSTHESVSNLSRNEERVALMLFQSGYLEVEERKGDWQNYTTVRSMPGTFVDENRNYALDEGELQKTFSLGAAATKKIKAAEGGSLPEGSDEARLLVLADANAIADAIIRNRGNAVFALDSIRWLAGQSEFSGETSSEEDVKIRHTRKEDAIWFNLTVGVVPMLVLGAGYIATRRKRRKDG